MCARSGGYVEDDVPSHVVAVVVGWYDWIREDKRIRRRIGHYARKKKPDEILLGYRSIRDAVMR